jgi:hypothetical protein
MPRRLTIKTNEKGDLPLYLIYADGTGHWEQEWASAQDLELSSLLTTVPKETMDHALAGWTKPLVDALGIPPEGALRKLPVANRVCGVRKRCPYYEPNKCVPLHQKMPWCFEPDGLKSDESRHFAARLIQLWREKVYVVVVTHAD